MQTQTYLLLVCLAMAACDTETAPVQAVFETTGAPTGARLWLEAGPDKDAPTIEVHGAELGEVFGFSAHLRYGAETMTLVRGDLDRVLGDDTEAATLVTLRDGDAVMGEARRGLALGAVPIDAPTRLGAFEVGEVRADVTLSLERVVVRRSDGSYVDVALGGGVFRVEGEP